MSEEVAALRSLSRHLQKRGDSAESLIARARSQGSNVDFNSIYRLLANDGFRLPPSSVTLLMHMLGDEITEKKFSSVLSMADTVGSESSLESGPSDAAWGRLSLALAGGDESVWKQHLLMAKTKAESDEMNFWLFSKNILRPLLSKYKTVFSTQELESVMQGAACRPGFVSIRKFEQTMDKYMATSKNMRNQQSLYAGDHGPAPEVKPVLSASKNNYMSKFTTKSKPSPSSSSSSPSLSSSPVTATKKTPATITIADDSDSDDEEAFFKSLEMKAKLSKGTKPSGGGGGGGGGGGVLKSSLKPADLYGSLGSNTGAKKQVSISPFLNVKTISPNVNKQQTHKQEEEEDEEEDDDDGSYDESGSEDESSEDDDVADAKATPKYKPAAKASQSFKATPPAPPPPAAAAPAEVTVNNDQGEGSITDMFNTLFSFDSSSSSSSSTSSSTPSLMSFPFNLSIAEEKTPSSMPRNTPSPPQESTSSSTSSASTALVNQPPKRQSFLGLFMEFDNLKEQVETSSKTQQQRRAEMEGARGSSTSAIEVNPLAMMFSAFESAVTPDVIPPNKNSQNMNSRNVASASSSSNMDKKRINRERTAKEIAAEETEKKMKEEARADIAARVAAETKAKLLEAENAKKELEEAQRKVAEAEENAYAAKAGVSQAAARTEMALRAAEQALINEEGHTLTNLQPEATLSDTALRNIALGVNGTGGAGGATKKDLAPTPLIDKEDEYGFNPAAAGEPTPALLFDNNNNLKTNTTKNGVFNIRRKSSRNTNDDGRSVKSGRSRASRASQASSGASLGTAVSYSTAGSESEFGDVSDGKGGTKKIRKNGDTIGWSRTETRLLMALVDEEARNAQSTPGGFMWDAVATALRKRLKEDLTIAARGKPQRRKAIDCRRRWDHVLKKAHSTPTHKLTAEQKQWMVAYQSQKSMMGIGGGMKSKNSRKVIESIPEDQEVSGSGREIV